jgi:glutamate racemase
MDMNTLPIGVFDSGVGGLTVLQSLKQALPTEDFIYLGDTARLPYGSKSKQTVIQYAHQAAGILDKKVKCLVVACNTASSVALDDLQKSFPNLPIIGVVEPGAQACVNTVQSGKVLVLATESTTRWHAYQQAIASLNTKITVTELPCPLFVALAEEGWTNGVLVEQIAHEVLKDSLNETYGCVVLGCTHFPMLKGVIAKCFNQVPVIDSASVVAAAVKTRLSHEKLLNPKKCQAKIDFIATDSIERFKAMASKFMGIDLSHDQIVLHSDTPSAFKATTR